VVRGRTRKSRYQSGTFTSRNLTQSVGIIERAEKCKKIDKGGQKPNNSEEYKGRARSRADDHVEENSVRSLLDRCCNGGGGGGTPRGKEQILARSPHRIVGQNKVGVNTQEKMWKRRTVWAAG